MKIITVFAVFGDFTGIGDGKLLGIFSSKEEADKNIVGCGSLDCGGNGIVCEREALEFSNGNIMLLSKRRILPLNVMQESEARKYHPIKLAISSINEFQLNDEELKMSKLDAIKRYKQRTRCDLSAAVAAWNKSQQQ